MSAADNPYRTPRALSDGAREAASVGDLTVLRRACRGVAFGAIGFATFSGMGVTMIWALDAHGGSPLGLGVLGAVLFAASEALFLAPRPSPRFIARFLATALVFIAANVVSVCVAEALGWRWRAYRSDPDGIGDDWLPFQVLSWTAFVLAQLAARWIMATWYREGTPEGC